jgi:hypothetical protein
VGSDTERRSRLSGAKQDESGLAIFAIVAYRVRLIDFSLTLESSSAGQASSLVTQCRQDDSSSEGRVPDVPVAAHLNRSLALGKEENDREHRWVWIHGFPTITPLGRKAKQGYLGEGNYGL